jgi:hypothetical protein
MIPGSFPPLSNPFGADVTNVPVSELLLRTSIQARAILSKSQTEGTAYVCRPHPGEEAHWMTMATIIREKDTLHNQFDFNLYSGRQAPLCLLRSSHTCNRARHARF